MTDSPLTTIETIGAASVIVFGPSCELVEDSLLEPLGAELLAAVRSATPPKVVLDLSRTRFFGSGFIEVLLRIWRELQLRPESTMILCGVQTYCREVLQITHLDHLWPIVETRQEALDHLTEKSVK